MFKIIKNVWVEDEDSYRKWEYLLINTTSNQMCRKIMTPTQANKFAMKLEFEPTAPIELLGKNYEEVSWDDFDVLPF